jgi:hypothetical protein
MLRILGPLSLLIGSALSVPAQQTKSPDPHPDEVLKVATEKNENVDLVYGRIKELKGGQKIVIEIDNAPDKTYNLADKDRTIKVAESLAIGDFVKIMESKEGKGVQIVRDVKAEQGQRSRTDQKK